MAALTQMKQNHENFPCIWMKSSKFAKLFSRLTFVVYGNIISHYFNNVQLHNSHLWGAEFQQKMHRSRHALEGDS